MHARRRAALADRLGDGVFVLGGGSITYRNADTEHLFRQSSDFSYLTGCQEPDAVLLVGIAGGEPQSFLFLPEPDPEIEAYTGRRVRPDEAVDVYGVDESRSINDLGNVLAEQLLDRPTLYWRPGVGCGDSMVNPVVDRARGWTHLGVGALRVEDPLPPLHDLRLRKDDIELAAMRGAAAISAEAHREAMRYAAPGLAEHQVQAAIEFVFRHRGAPREAYPSIVASGPNACTLHYVNNDRTMADGDLLLIDAGTEVDGMASDITRTFPVGGSYSPAQRAVYDVVLAALTECSAAAGPGSSLPDLHTRSTEVLTEGLVELGVIPGPIDRALAMHHYRAVYPHSLSHWLGRDVHDVGTQRVGPTLDELGAGKPRPFEPGMAFTIEPGVYISPYQPTLELAELEYDVTAWRIRRARLGATAAKKLEAQARDEAPVIHHEVPPDLVGIGIRIEDDVVVTADGVEVLTAAVPKDPDEIEVLCAQSPTLPRSLH